MLSLLGGFLILLGRVAKVLSHPDEAAYIRIYNPYTKYMTPLLVNATVVTK